MLPILTTPLALVGLATLPALVAVYVLRNRSRLQPVSSLLLWVDPRSAPDGGTRVERFRSSLLFWLEFLALLLLVLAASAPWLPTSAGAQPLVVVLDDSFSMLAGGLDSSRKRAGEALVDELRYRPSGSVRLILAGDRAQLLGDGARQAGEVAAALDNWTCQAATARLDLALGLAFELGGDRASVLVLTDHAAPPTADPARIRWWSFGKPLPNWAFVTATRSTGPRGDRILLEIANLADDSRSTTFRLETGSPARELQRSELSLKPRETHRVVLELPDGANAPGTVRAMLTDDDLPYDNAVSLVPAQNRTVLYDNRLTDPKLRQLVERAVRAADGASPAKDHPHLVFVDADTPAPGADAWMVRVLAEPDAEAFTGPFVLDRSHPLTDGLGLAGVVWGGGKTAVAGAPVVMAGNIALVTDNELNGRHEIRLRFRPDLSGLQENPAWPTLFANLIRWRSQHLPGFDRPNIRLGEESTWTAAAPITNAALTGPGGDVTPLPVGGRRLTLHPTMPGVYTLRVGDERGELAVNPLNKDESDLTKCSTGRSGEERSEKTLQLEYRDMTWLPLLLALGVVLGHLWFVAGARKR